MPRRERKEHASATVEDNMSRLRVAFAEELFAFLNDWVRSNGLDQVLADKPSAEGMQLMIDAYLAMLAGLAHEAGAISSLLSGGKPEADVEVEEVFVQQYRASRDQFRGELRSHHRRRMM